MCKVTEIVLGSLPRLSNIYICVCDWIFKNLFLRTVISIINSDKQELFYYLFIYLLFNYFGVV